MNTMTMEEETRKKKTKKKGTISEDDVCTLLQRYTAATILALLQEVSQFAGAKIDWKTLVKKSSTGITSAREYQMLWRHLAYSDTLMEPVVGADPLDDDSDLEFEVETVPSISKDASSEAAAYVKVLMSSGLQRELCPGNLTTVEAPLVINIPIEQVSHVPLDEQPAARCIQGMNIVVPVSVQKQSSPTGPLPDDEMPSRKRRKAWTKEEEMELIAAVQKFGEGNWRNILKGEFKHDRTALQLSQRWTAIRKRETNIPGIGNKPSNSMRSEERLAAQKAISMAIDMPMKRSLSAVFSGTTQSNTPASTAVSALFSEAQPVSVPQRLGPPQQASNQVTSQKVVSNPSNKARATPKKPAALVTSSTCPNSSIQAAAFAAGGRIATPSTAASLFKAAQSKTAVHFKPTGNGPPKPSGPAAKLLPGTNILGPVQKFGPVAHHTQSTLTSPNSKVAVLKPGSQKGQGFSGRDRTSSASPSSTVSNQLAQSATKLGSPCTASQENDEETCGSIFSTIDVGELLNDEGGDADVMELDAVAQDNQAGLGSLDMAENGDHVSRVSVDVSGSLSKLGSSQSQTGDRRTEIKNTQAAEDQAVVVDDGGTRDLA